MDVKFYNNTTQVGSTQSSVNRVSITYDSSGFYVDVGGSPSQIDCILGEA